LVRTPADSDRGGRRLDDHWIFFWLKTIDEIVHPDYRYRSPGSEMNGIAELKSFISDFRKGFPDLNLKIDEQIIDRDKACTCFTLTGTHMEAFMGVPATKQQVEVHGCALSKRRQPDIS
jgi:hypothetical protein